MNRHLQRRLLLLCLAAAGWGSGLLTLAWFTPGQPALWFAAWASGVLLLLLLALLFGLAWRLDLLQVQQALRAAAMGAEPARAGLDPGWWPLIDAAAPLPKPDAPDDAAQRIASLQVQIESLQSTLSAERLQTQAWQRHADQAQAEAVSLRQQLQQAMQAVTALESATAACSMLDAAIRPADAAQDLLPRLTDMLSAFSGQVKARDAAAQQQADAATAARAVLREREKQLAQTATDLQLFGLNLRLQLAHLHRSGRVDPVWIEQTEADLDALLAGAAQLAEATQVPDPSAVLPLPAMAPATDTTMAQIEHMADEIVAAARSAAAQHAQWVAMLRQVQQGCEALRQQLGRARLSLQTAAQRSADSRPA
ncbi:MAG: chemotaxis protein [Thiomonas sp.]